MTRAAADLVQRIASLGGGPIGGGWTAHFMARGYDVVSYLHDPREEESFRKVVDTAWISLETLRLAEGANRARLRITSDLAEAVRDAEFVQESAPEDLAIKQALYEQLGHLVPQNVVIASSTSGLTMSEIQVRCPTPERTAIGHPFNPPYLLPLVEIVGGARSDAKAVQWTCDFYRAAGKAPLVLKKEIPGFVATRLQEALWREALHMVANGEVFAMRCTTSSRRRAVSSSLNSLVSLSHFIAALKNSLWIANPCRRPVILFHIFLDTQHQLSQSLPAMLAPHSVGRFVVALLGGSAYFSVGGLKPIQTTK